MCLILKDFEQFSGHQKFLVFAKLEAMSQILQVFSLLLESLSSVPLLTLEVQVGSVVTHSFSSFHRGHALIRIS